MLKTIGGMLAFLIATVIAPGAHAGTITFTTTGPNDYTVLKCTTSACSSTSSIVSGTPLATNVYNTSGQFFLIEASGANTTTSFGIDSLSFTAVPEPATFGLVGLALVGLGTLKLKRRRG
jgi:hypothetical protein